MVSLLIICTKNYTRIFYSFNHDFTGYLLYAIMAERYSSVIMVVIVSNIVVLEKIMSS